MTGIRLKYSSDMILSHDLLTRGAGKNIEY